jgi:predicted DNA-binding transcriptional regulator AlpA
MTKMELLTAAEVGAKLKLSKDTIWNWHYGRKPAPEGFPPSIKISSAVRWRLSDIDSYISGVPFTTFGCIKCPVVLIEESKKILVSDSTKALNFPARGRGRPRKIATSLARGKK